MESIADLLLSSSVGVGGITLHAGNGIGTSLDDTLESIDDIVEAGASTARAGTKERNTVHGVEGLSDGGKTLGLLGDLLDGSNHLTGGDFALLDRAG